MIARGKGLSGYTVFWNDEDADVDFWAEDDLAAMVEACSIADIRGKRTFRLCRTGFDQTVIREVADITDKIC